VAERSDPEAPDVVEAPAHRVGFLLSTLGFTSQRRWAERLRPLGLDARQAAMLRHVASIEGRSQQALATALRIPASRVVALVDDLEHRGLLERRPDPRDRRVRALHLTQKGKRLLARVMELSEEHEAELSAGLRPAERRQLVDLLRRLAAREGGPIEVHPGIAAPHAER
jgi:DNA-binding MarR family transcriptional regulator